MKNPRKNEKLENKIWRPKINAEWWSCFQNWELEFSSIPGFLTIRKFLLGFLSEKNQVTVFGCREKRQKKSWEWKILAMSLFSKHFFFPRANPKEATSISRVGRVFTWCCRESERRKNRSRTRQVQSSSHTGRVPKALKMKKKKIKQVCHFFSYVWRFYYLIDKDCL